MGFFGDLKKLGSQSVIYGMSTAVGRMIGLITAPILTRIFTPADYGVISLVQIALGLAVIFAGMNIGSGVTYYYYHHADETTKKDVLSSGLVVVVLLGALIAGALYEFAPQIDLVFQKRLVETDSFDLAPYLRIGAFGLFFGIIKTSLQTFLRLFQEPQKYFRVELITLLSTFMLTMILVVWLRLGVEGVFWSSVGGGFFGMLLGFRYCISRVGRNVSWVLLVPIFTYAAPQLPGVFVNWVQSQSGRFFINYYTTLTEQGLYSIAFTLASALVMVTSAFRLAYDPYALSIMSRDDAKDTYAKVYSIYAFVFGVLLAAISGFAKPILMILTPVEYYSAHTMVFWLAAAGFLMGANNILGTGIWITRRTIFTSYAQICTFIMVIAMSYLLVPLLGAKGAAVAFFMGAFAQSLAYYMFAQRLYSIDYNYWPIKLMLLCLVLLGWLVSEYSITSGFRKSMAVGGVGFLSALPLCFFLAFTSRQKVIIVDKLLSMSIRRLFRSRGDTRL